MYFLLRAAIEENAFNRMKKVVKWYISGFYKKPKVSRISCVFLGGFDVFWKIVMLYIISCRSTGIEEALQSHYRRDISLRVASPKDQQQNLLHWGTGDNNIKHRGIKKRDCSKHICDMRCFSAGIPSSPSVGILCQQQEGWILPQWQHPCQVQILWY